MHRQGPFHGYFSFPNISFYSYRIVMAIDLELWYIRSILFIGISSHLGPKIVMIRKMVCSVCLRDYTYYFIAIVDQ